jgi:hypothetical protein
MATKIPTLQESPTVREYLNTYGAFIKKLFGGEAVADFGNSLGYKSRITYRNVTQGKRPVYQDETPQISQALDLSASEREVLQKKLDGDVTVENREDKFFVSPGFFDTPLNTIILNLCGLQKPISSARIHQAMKDIFSVEQIEKSINTLLELKLIAKTDEGLKRIFEGSITTPPGMKIKSSRDYFKRSYELADMAWELPLEQREIHSFTLRLNSDDIPKLKEALREVRTKLSSITPAESANAVFQCSLAAFPVFIDEPEKTTSV